MIILILVIVGLCLGSFVNALVWRLHQQAKGGERQKTKSKDDSLSIVHGRSMCPDCHHQLATKELVPVFSWLALKGTCRYCGKPISWQYPAVELLTAGLFAFSYIYWPLVFHGVGLFEFVLWLIFLVGFIALTVYDLKWWLLPNRIVYPLLVLALVQVLVAATAYHGGVQTLLGAFWGALLVGGLFYVLFQLSQGKWIGGGDVRLGALLGLLVAGPFAAILLLFAASFAGTIASLPLILSGRARRTTRIPFGPLLILGAIIARLFGASIDDWLLRLSI